MKHTLPILRALNPRQRLLTLAFTVFMTWIYVRNIFHLPAPLQALVGLGLIIPFVHATRLVASLHSVMHRNNFPLLPNARTRLRSLYCLETATLACACLGAARLLSPDTPLCSIAGLQLAMFGLPLLNPRKRRFFSGSFKPFYTFSLMILAATVLWHPAWLNAVLTPYPLLTLLLGLALALVSLKLGFDPERVRARQQVPFIGLHHLLTIKSGHAEAFANVIGTGNAQSDKLGSETKQPPLKSDRHSPRFWLEAMTRAQFPLKGVCGNSERTIFVSVLVFLPLALVPLVLACLLGKTTSEEIADTLLLYAKGSNTSNPSSYIANSIPVQLLIVIPFMVSLISLYSVRLRLRIPLPASRKTLAACIFRHMLTNAAWVCALPLSLIPIIVACALWRQAPLGFWVASRMFSLSIIFLPLCPLISASSFGQTEWLRALTPGFAMGLLVGIVPHLTTVGPGGLPGNPKLLIACLLLTPMTVLMFRRTLHARYLRGDLTGEFCKSC